MKLPVLQVQSEKYGHYGNISAQGIQKLLGAPSLDRLQTVIREAVQNSCDAALANRQPVFHLGLRRLQKSEMLILRNNVFADTFGAGKNDDLVRFLQKKSPYVLELSDFETSGLGGPTDPAEVVSEGEETDYVDFVRNIGSPRDTDQGGGTYGYGKSSLYGMSRCNTILIDSLAINRGRKSRRLAAARIANSFSISKGVGKGKYTGRHWWGVYRDDGETNDPLSGQDAASLAAKLGLPDRSSDATGTTIVILDPLLDDDPDSIIQAAQRSLLWNFWPKMIRYSRKPAAMKFGTFLNTREIALPDPKACPPLDLFVESLIRLKKGDAESIRCGNPSIHLGKLCIQKGQRGDRISGFDELYDGMFPDRSCHVALMRPVELVVKYLEGDPFPSDVVEWAGCFVSSDVDEVEQAFADSEPPAHDDWIHDFLPRGRAKTFVRTALRKIKENMGILMSSKSVAQADEEELPLAPLADRMGSLLNRSMGDGLSTGKGRGTGGGGARNPKTFRIRNLTGHNPAPLEDGSVLAWFKFEVVGPTNSSVRVTGNPGVYIDGEVASEAPNGEVPEIRVWLDENEEFLSSEVSIDITVSSSSLLWVGISIPGDVAVTFTPKLLTS